MKFHRQHITKIIDLKDKLNSLYIHLVIQAIAVSMVSVFIPVFLLQRGFSLSEVYFFLLVLWASFALLAPICALLISRMGIKEVILFRVPLFILSLVLLLLIDKFPALRNFYPIVAFFLGLSSVLYSLSISSIFVKFMHKSKDAFETGKFLALPSLGAMAGPFLGGLIAEKLSMITLFILTAVILFISVIPLFFLKSSIDHPGFDFRKFLLLFLKYKRLIWFINLYGIIGFAFGIVLPVILYVRNPQALSLGIIVSVISFLNIVFTLIIGKITDGMGKKKVLKFGAIITAIAFFILGFFSSTPLIAYTAALLGIVIIFFDIPFEAGLYEAAKECGSSLEFLAFKEICFFPGRTLFFISLIVFVNSQYLAFYLGGISTLLMIFY